MKTLLGALAFIIISFFNVKAQTSESYLITEKNEKVVIQGDVELGAGYISFNGGPKGKTITYTHKEIKFLTSNNRFFLTLPLYGGKMKTLQEIVCYNDKYILTAYFDGHTHDIIVFDWDLKRVKPLTIIDTRSRKQEKNIEEDIKPFFGDCKNVMDMVYKHVADKQSAGYGGRNEVSKNDWLMDGLYAYNCSSNKNINTIIKNVMDAPAPEKK
jgi:hypothetical protein